MNFRSTILLFVFFINYFSSLSYSQSQQPIVPESLPSFQQPKISPQSFSFSETQAAIQKLNAQLSNPSSSSEDSQSSIIHFPDQPWTYTNIKSPPPWLNPPFLQTPGLPSTQPPPVPLMIPPPLPLATLNRGNNLPLTEDQLPPPPSFALLPSPPFPTRQWLPLSSIYPTSPTSPVPPTTPLSSSAS